MSNALKHVGILGMKWGKRKSPQTQSIADRASKVLNNPKSSKKDVDLALESIGVNSKTGKSMRTKPRYDTDGNDISVNPERRFGKKKGQSDKDFDKEFDAEMLSDPDRNPTPANLAKRKVEDLKMDQSAKKHAIAMIATVAGITVLKYLAMQSLKKSANASILAKYGPEMFELLKIK